MLSEQQQGKSLFILMDINVISSRKLIDSEYASVIMTFNATYHEYRVKYRNPAVSSRDRLSAAATCR